jgi:hypothetical protein
MLIFISENLFTHSRNVKFKVKISKYLNFLKYFTMLLLTILREFRKELYQVNKYSILNSKSKNYLIMKLII